MRWLSRSICSMVVSIFILFACVPPVLAQENEHQHPDNSALRLIELSQNLRLQDEIATNSITTYTYTNDLRWLERHDNAVTQFEGILSEIKRIYRGDGLIQIKLIEGANEALVALERRSQKLMLSGEAQDAQLLLESIDYVSNKKQLKEAIDAFAHYLEADLADTFLIDDSVKGSQLGTTELQTSKLSLTESEEQWIADNPIATVGKEIDWPPFNFTNSDGHQVGITIDILNLITKKTGLGFQFSEPASYAELHQMLAKNKIDIIGAAYFSEDRSTYSLHTPSYIVLQEYIYVKSSSDIRSMDDLNGHTLAIPKGYATTDIIRRERPDINIIETDSILDAIELVLEEQADATVDSQSVIEYYLREHALSGFRSFPADIGTHPLLMLVNGSKPILHSILTKAIISITREERLEILDDWLQTESNTPVTYSVPATSLTVEQHEWLNNHPVIKIAGDPDWRPFEFADERGQYSGIAAEYLNFVSDQLGIKFEFVQTDNWNELSNFPVYS